MLNRLLPAVLSGFFLFLPLACDQPEAEDYFPLATGNIWEYQALLLRNTPVATETLEQWGGSVHITGKAMLYTGDSAWVWARVENDDADTAYYQENGDRIWRYEDQDNEEPDLFLTLPLEKDNLWNVDEDITACVLRQETLTTPGGTYKKCWVVAWIEDGDTSCYFWFAPNVGIARYEEAQDRRGDTTYLIRYDVKSHLIRR